MSRLRKYLVDSGRPYGLWAALLLVILTLSLTWPRAAPAAGTWSGTSPLSTARRYHTATRLADGRVLVAGDSISELDSVEIYDPHNFVGNCDFETASVDPGGGLLTLATGSTAIAHWTVGGAGIDYIGGVWQPAEGRRSLDLSALDPGSIQQGFGTIPGWHYLVTFALAGNPGGGPTVKSLRASAGGQSKDFSFDTTGRSTTNMGWTVKSWTFTATSYWTVLQFQSLTPGSYGPALDKVRVIRATPMPPLLLLD